MVVYCRIIRTVGMVASLAGLYLVFSDASPAVNWPALAWTVAAFTGNLLDWSNPT